MTTQKSATPIAYLNRLRKGSRVRIAGIIGHGGDPWPINKWGSIKEVYPSSVIVKVDGDPSPTNTYQVTSVFETATASEKPPPRTRPRRTRRKA